MIEERKQPDCKKEAALWRKRNGWKMLCGTVDRVVFHNMRIIGCWCWSRRPWTKYKGGRRHADGGRGRNARLMGNWVEHPSFGFQFRPSCERSLPTGGMAILRYLSSGAVKGVGPSTAARIVEKFGRTPSM